jgi:hypothetical protein
MSVLNPRVSFCFGLLLVLAACTGDDNGGGGGATSDDASTESGTPGGDGAVAASPDGTVNDSGGGTTSGDDASPAEAGEASAGEAGPTPGDAGPSDASDASDGAEVTNGLVLYYPFNDGTGTTVSDTSGGAHNGTFENHSDSGDPAAWTTGGRSNGAVVFSGAQDVVVPSGVLTSVTDMTIGVWVKLQSIAPFARVFDFGNGPLGTGNHWTFLTPSGISGVEWDMYGGTAADGSAQEEALLSGTQLPTSVWKHIAMTASGANYQMYIDGFPAAEVTNGVVITPSEMEPLTPASWLGKSRFPTDPYLNGTVDELRIYDRILTASEIADLAWPQHDYSDWRFDEGTGATAVDSSDNAISGTLSGGAAWTATGRLGAAVDLPGGTWPDAGAAGPQVDFASNPLASCTTAFTVASWVKIHSQNAWARLFDFGTAKTAFVYLAPKGGTGMHFGMASPSGAPYDLEAPAAVPADDAWHHMAVTVDANDNVVLYIDGASVVSGSAAKDAATYVKAGDFTAITDYSLGKSRFSDPYLNGAIDDLRISCRAYTGDEIKSLAHGH